ncbi:unnamed protein product, partial [Ranitomeya imitator]
MHGPQVSGTGCMSAASLNAAARIIFLNNRYTDASTLCQSLHWLPIHSRIQYKTTTLIHKAVHGSAPPYISSLVSVYHPTRALRSANDLSDKTFCLEAEQQLSEERDEYKACTVHPIWQLRDDLKHRICQLKHHSFLQSQMENDFDPVNIMKEVESVKSQQKVIIEKLIQEQRALENELLVRDLQECVDTEEKTLQFGEVPAVLLELYCPYPELKTSILTDYQQLVGVYQSRMEELDRQHKDID